jgi:hypothetical protein
MTASAPVARPRRLGVVAKFTILLSAAASFGFTSCDSFTTVTIPTSDTTAPLMVTKVNIAGTDHILFNGDNFAVSDDDANVIVIPAMIDSGGARRLTFTPHAVTQCHDANVDPELSQRVDSFFPSTSDEQAGAPGDKVSNGIYLYKAFRFSDFTHVCGAGFTLVSVEFSWTARGVDFFGNASPLKGTVTYRPPS